MPTYDIEQSDGKKYTLESKEALTPKEIAAAVKRYAQVVTERKVGDVTERTIYAKKGSPTPLPKSELATDSGEDDEPRSAKFIRNAQAEIAAEPRAPRDFGEDVIDTLDKVQEVFGERRTARGKMPFGVPKLFQDTRDLIGQAALTPLTIGNALGAAAARGTMESQAKGEFPGVGIAKNLAPLGAAALPFGGEALEAASQSKSAAEFPSRLKASVLKSLSESPVGGLLDVLPVGKMAGIAASGALVAGANKWGSKTPRPMSVVSSRAPEMVVRQAQNTLPPRPINPLRKRGPLPAFHRDPENFDDGPDVPRTATPRHGDRGSGRLRYEDTDEQLRVINKVFGRDEDYGLLRPTVDMKDWERQFLQSPAGQTLTAQYLDPNNKIPVRSIEEQFALKAAYAKLLQRKWELEDIRDTPGVSKLDHDKALAEEMALGNQLFFMETSLLRPFVSESSRALLAQKSFSIQNPWHYEGVIRQVEDLINFGKTTKIPVSARGKEAIARLTTRMRRVDQAMMKKLDAEVIQSQDIAGAWFQKHKTLLEQEEKVSTRLKTLREKRAKLVEQLRSKMDKDGDTPAGFEIPVETLLQVAETAFMAPAGLLLGVGGGGVGPKKPTARSPKQKAADAIKEIDKEVKTLTTKRKSLSEQIALKMKEAEAELEELGSKPLGEPLPKRPRRTRKTPEEQSLRKEEIEFEKAERKKLNEQTVSDREARKAMDKALREEEKGKLSEYNASVSQGNLKAAASANARQAALDQLDNLGAPKEKKVRNTLIDEAAAGLAKDVRNLDQLAASYQQKYGVKLGEATLAKLFDEAAQKIRDNEEAYNYPQIKGELLIKINEEIDSHKPTKEKIWDAAGEFGNIMRSIMASGDISYIGKQIGLAAAAHPAIAAKSAIPGVKTLYKGLKPVIRGENGKLRVNDLREAWEYTQKVEGEILANAGEKYGNPDFYTKVAKLDLNVPPPDLKNGWFSLLTPKDPKHLGQEELASSLAHRIPGLKNWVNTSDMAFAAGRNWAATKVFDKMFDRERMTDEDAVFIGKMVNVLTGRTNIEHPLVVGLGGFMFSPRFTFSRWEWTAQVLGSMGGLNPWHGPWGATGEAGKAMRIEMGKVAAGYAGLYATAFALQQAGAPIELGTDPTSTTFGLIRLPSGGYLDPSAGLKGLLVTAYRFASGTSTNLAGISRDVGAEMWWRYQLSKMNPPLGTGLSRTPMFEPDKWRDFNGKLQAEQMNQDATKIAQALGFIPSTKVIEMAPWLAAEMRMASKSFTPLTLGQLVEDTMFYAQKEGLQPEEYAYIMVHLLLNTTGYNVMNYDANRAPNPNRKRGSSNPFALPDPMRGLDRQMNKAMSLPGL